MSERLTIQMEVTDFWLRRKVFYFPKDCLDIFPSDCFGARGKEDQALWPLRGAPVTFDFGLEQADMDVARRKDNQSRPRDSGPVGRFYNANRAKTGDFVVVTRTAPRTFKVELVSGNGAAV